MGGGGGNTTNSTKWEPPAYMMPYIQDYLKTGNKAMKQPYQAYKGEMVADFTKNQNLGMSMAAQRALNGSPYLNNAGNQINRTINGGYLGQGVAKNGMANVSSAFQNSHINDNSAFRNELAGTNSATVNQLAGVDNPYLNSVVNRTNSDIANKFQNSVMPTTDSNFARAGAFGGSAWQQAQQNNAQALAKELADNTSNLRYQDYGKQQELFESQAAREQQAIRDQQQFAENYAVRRGEDVRARQELADAFAARQQTDVMNRQTIAESLAARQSEMYNQERARMMQAFDPAMALHNQRYQDADILMNVGTQQQRQQQNELDALYNQFLERRNYPLQQLGIFGNLISTGSTGAGQAQSTQPGYNRYSSNLGGAMSGLGAIASLYKTYSDNNRFGNGNGT